MDDNGIWGVLILEETVKFFPTVYQIVLVFNVLCDMLSLELDGLKLTEIFLPLSLQC